MPAPQARRPRADAVRNRERLLAAAERAFNAEGADTSLDDIAHAADVGNATLYRHFPTRQALIAAVYAERIEHLCASAADLRAEEPTGEALTAWLRLVIDHTTRNRGLRDAFVAAYRIRHDEETPEVAEWHRATHEAATPLLQDAQAAGRVRVDVDIDELIGLTTAIAQTGNGDRPFADRLLTLALEGVRARTEEAPG
ncbi:TetR/AcrR family transcriptional regulator [Streptomyces radicis]|uniref:TetR/AcrR family transcriptional regulator n=1 Tax=Streptomyces radicis TaxID=1750517 RepID=A0A3A9VTK0_9ACTN|nr:TetR/AcrR family transcriptional regulator [Streptomyces radicis]RKN04060.1 TetR/AcrR family transcriptional regulator [Streptomyces radicis]RKN14459.1 TetR/AcrR family transcriptional regulator [Streptomyces radicis]